MDFDALEGFGVEAAVIDAWKAGFGASLLPVQERAVKRGLLAGKNLIVFAPTSSGKTAIGEMAAVKAAREGKRVFYLVPLKALADEKYAEFRGRYGPLGLEVVVSSRDHAEFDERILQGRYRLAVCTFEKLWALLISRPVLAESIGLVVVDELQMISDPERGGVLELILTLMRRAKGRPQIVGLSAVLEQADALAAWMEAEKIAEVVRPVELRKGVLLNGAFQYIEHNSGQSGTERLFEWVPEARPAEDELLDAALLGIRHLAETLGEQTILFVSDRKAAVGLARKCLPLLGLPPAEKALAELSEFEDCEAKEALTELLGGGIAFHHADLSQSCRALIEKHFRSGGIRVVFSTPTLAMGVNLPARNVIVFPRRWRRDPRHGWVAEPLSRMEFENYAGRAARLGYGGPFGRAIIPESSEFEKDLLFDRYLRSPFEPLAPALQGQELEETVLSLISSGVVASREELTAFLGSTFSGPCLEGPAASSLDRLVAEGLVALADGRARVTDLGRAIAGRGMRPSTGIALAAWARAHAGAEDLEVLAALGTTPDGRDMVVPLGRREHLEQGYETLLRARVPHHELLRSEYALGYDDTLAVKKAFIALDWIQEKSLCEIERGHRIWGGAAERLGEDLAWLLEGFADVAACVKWDAAARHRLKTLAARLRAGIREDLLPLGPARTRGVGRRELRRLLACGLATMDALRAASFEKIAEAIGASAAEDLRDHLGGVTRVDLVGPKKPAHGARLVLVGEARSHGRSSILVDGVERLVSHRHFELLLTLAAKDWLPLADVGGDLDTARKEILRLRAKLAAWLRLAGPEILRTDGRKRYRLVLTARVDRRSVKKHQPDLATSPP